MRQEMKYRIAVLLLISVLLVPLLVIGPEYFVWQRIDAAICEPVYILVLEMIFCASEVDLLKNKEYRITDTICTVINVIMVILFAAYMKKSIDLGFFDRI